MELVQEKNASSILADLTSRSLASSSFCALPLSKEFASSSPPERKLLFFCIPGCLSPQHQHQATRLAGLLCLLVLGPLGAAAAGERVGGAPAASPARRGLSGRGGAARREGAAGLPG